MKAFETVRLLIRPFVIGDLDELYNLYNRAELMRYVDGGVRSHEETRVYLQGYIADYERYGFGLCAAIFKSTGQMIGRCGLIPIPTEAGVEGELVFMFKKDYWGLGLATEFCQAMVRYAFDKIQLTRVFATANRHHLASIRVLQKTGMHCLRSTSKEVEYEIHRSEWSGGLSHLAEKSSRASRISER
jgi:ribosomal-protein-alanine N-acetyltransferase